ncbi:MAG: xanthan lyase [Bacteroidales bacterium]|nr:xanthan lyase [Bacteroidales bacterium]
MKKTVLIILFMSIFCLGASGQSAIVKDFQPACDSLGKMILEKQQIRHGTLKLKNVMKRGNVLDFYFTESLGDYPWRKGEPEWFRKSLRSMFPERYRSYSLGRIYSRSTQIEDFVTVELGYDGRPVRSQYQIEGPESPASPVMRLGVKEYAKGLQGRNIAVWQSHGRYFDQSAGKWIWQRPCLFQTVEDMFTQSFVLPYLVPMLENAGAYVMLPRERDIQTHEVIADFDIIDEAYGNATYKETGRWKDAGVGFAAEKPEYTGTENPFVTGGSRMAECTASKAKATAEWRPEIPERGEYAVYVSYRSLPNSSTSAHYTVSHLGGKSEFAVNQTIGGGTWIYLGTFEFDKGTNGFVTLSNAVPQGFSLEKGSVVTADAVRFGGGMGNIARKAKGSKEEPQTSGMPRSAEGARYWLQWAGADDALFSQNEDGNDYKDDYMCRGDWVEWISRGSYMNPKKEGGLGIPVDLTLGFHSDAGIAPGDTIVGTLAIYTSKSEGKAKLPGGESRMTSREYSDIVQSQIVNDLRSTFDPDWNRRCIWDRSYRESRTPSCPSMLLELLSHQNFADMKYGLDPTFRFTVSRAVYKGMLKYISNRYGVEYAVQPLPVSHMGVVFGNDGKAVISWKETRDELEPTATADGFILYTRVDNGAFDTGTAIKAKKGNDGRYSTEVSISPGHIYSYRIEARNAGGRSFPSETISIGIPKDKTSDKKVLIINNFDRTSGPAFIDTPVYAGFDNSLDSGVPHIRDIAYIGEMYQFRRNSEFVTNDNPGFGASYSDYAGKTVAGNTFDYPYVHGMAVLKAGHPFFSCSNEAFTSDSTFRKAAWSADLICGKQVTTVTGSSKEGRFQVYSPEMQKAITAFTADGGNLLVSGSNIATDVWDEVYPVQVDSAYRADTKKFAREVLGYKWVTSFGGRKGQVRLTESSRMGVIDGRSWEFHNTINSKSYCVENPDGISPASAKTASTFMRYSDTGHPAATCHEGKGYKTVCIGFPIETLKENKDIESIVSLTLEFFKK